LLVRREAYEKLGGHAPVAGKVLEDVELAHLFKSTGRKIWFRYGGGLVRTRMYRDFRSMCEGWTKNLALLFPHPLRLAFYRGLEFAVIAGTLLSSAVLLYDQYYAAAGAFFGFCILRCMFFVTRISKAHFPMKDNLAAFFGLPLFVWLLWRSWLHSNVRRAVTWKGRTYPHLEPSTPVESSTRKGSLT